MTNQLGHYFSLKHCIDIRVYYEQPESYVATACDYVAMAEHHVLESHTTLTITMSQ